MRASVGFHLASHTGTGPRQATPFEAYQAFLDVYSLFGLEPNWIGAVKKSSSKLVRFGSKKHTEFLNAQGEGYQSVSLTATPADSDAPSRDSLLSLDFFNFVGPQASLVCDQSVATFRSSHMRAALDRLLPLATWDYGYGMTDDNFQHLEIYLSGAATSSQEAIAIVPWYNSDAVTRRKKLRGVYPWYILGPEHLAHPLGSPIPDASRGWRLWRNSATPQTLEQFIRTDKNSELAPVADNLWLWTNADPDGSYGKLKDTGVIIDQSNYGRPYG